MRRTLLLGSVGVLLAFMLAAPTPVIAGRGPTGTVRAVVRYETKTGSKPLAGVEVFLGIVNPFAPLDACTDTHGIAVFTDVPADTDLISATGVSVSALRETCITNPEFLNPDTGKEMTVVAWRNHHGSTSTFDHFTVGDGTTFTVRFVAKTPQQHGRLCVGEWASWVGTSGPDRFTGTGSNDIINSGGGVDVIDGAGGDDKICGGPGGDTLRGGRGADWIFGGPGNDELLGGPGINLLVGGSGDDTCQGGTKYDCE